MNTAEKKSFYRSLLSLALPMAFQQLMLALVGVSDAVMLGFMSQDALSAVSLAGQVQFVYTLFLFAMTSGVSILAAQYWGIGDRRTLEKILGIGMRASVLISLPFTLGAMLCPELLMRAFASDATLIAYGAEYLRAVGISYLMLSVSQVCLCMLKNSGCASKCAAISGVSVIVNIIGNAVLIFGLAGFPALGITGAAIATVLSKVVELVWSVALMLRPDGVKLRLRDLFVHDRALVRDFWKYTLPSLGNQIVWGLGFTMYSVIMGHLGSDAAAANSIVNIVKNLTICFCCGIANASGVLIGGLLGRGEMEKAKRYGAKIVRLSILAGMVSGVLILCVVPFVPLFSTLTETAQGYLRVMLMCCSYYVIGKAINMTVIGGMFPAGGDSRFGFICDAVTMWVVVVPIGLLAAFVLELPVTAVYLLLNIDELIKLPAVYWNYKKYRWVQNLTRQPMAAEPAVAKA